MASSSISRPCAIHTCKHLSRALCNCCQEYLCINHLKNHSENFDTHLTRLTDEINLLSERLHHISLVEPYFITTLDKWRAEAHRTVDRFYERQRRQFEQFVQETKDKQCEEIDRIRAKLNELIREHDTTREHIDSIKSTIRSIERDFNELQHIQFTLRPLVIDDNLAALRPERISRDLLPLLRPYQTMKIADDSYCWMASNENYLLIHHKPELQLLDRQLNIVEKTPWMHGRIYVMCWSSTLERFIVITNETIFTLDEKLMTIERCDLSHHSDLYRQWRSGTCSNTNLFLSTVELGPSVYEFTLFPSFQFVKEWQSPITCMKDEGIDDLNYKNGQIAIIIFHQPSNETRLELRSSTTFNCFWSIELGHVAPRRTTGCCSIHDDQWLVTDEYDFRLFHISTDGHLLKTDKYEPAPYNAIQFGKDVLAIRTVEGVNLHKLL